MDSRPDKNFYTAHLYDLVNYIAAATYTIPVVVTCVGISLRTRSFRYDRRRETACLNRGGGVSALLLEKKSTCVCVCGGGKK